jgi:hypothetical protein
LRGILVMEQGPLKGQRYYLRQKGQARRFRSYVLKGSKETKVRHFSSAPKSPLDAASKCCICSQNSACMEATPSFIRYVPLFPPSLQPRIQMIH